MLYFRDGGDADDEPRGRRRVRIEGETQAVELQVGPLPRMFEENLLGFLQPRGPPNGRQHCSQGCHQQASHCCGA